MPSDSVPRLLLINPWIYDFSAFDLWSKPIGLLYLAAYLRQLGYKIDYIDCLDKYHPELLKRQGRLRPKIKKYGTGNFHREKVKKPAILQFVPRHFCRYGLPEDIFLGEIKSRPKPDAILITSLMTYWYPGPKRVVEIIREIFPKTPIILGGIYATLLPDHAKEIVRPDYIVKGPGEIQVAQLLNDILPHGLRDPDPPKTIDDFPYPAFDLYSHVDYFIVMSSRGCPYQCTFCASKLLNGSFVQRKPEFVVDEILNQAKKLKVRDVAFYDDALLINKERRLIPVLEKILESKKQFRFHTPNGLHAREIDRKLADLFYRTGFKTIRLSFESVSPERLSDMKSKVTPLDLAKAVENLVSAGYEKKSISAYVLFGLPEQPLEEVYQSILFVHALGIKVSLASFSPIPGTIDYQRSIQKKLFPADADPLLTNNSIYPLFRTETDYWKFHKVRQLVHALNEAIDRGVQLFQPNELRSALRSVLKMFKD